METKRRLLLEWGKNLMILLLAIMAFSLIRQSTLYEGFGMLSGGLQGNQTTIQPATFQGNLTISVQPVRIAVQNATGRYGMQYDSQVIDPIFEDKLGSMLREGLNNAQALQVTDQSDWQKNIRTASRFLYCDFMTDLPLRDLLRWLGSTSDNEALSGAARCFMLVEAAEGYRLYLADDANNQYFYYTTSLTDASRFATICDEFEPNGAVFAFEQPEQYPLPGNHVMILQTMPNIVRYEAKNPIKDMDKIERELLLQQLTFNPSLTPPYESADAIAVIREGTDTLRMLHSGSVVYQSNGGEQPRYQVDQDNDGHLIENVQELLGIILKDRSGEAIPYLMNMEKREDGVTVLSFGYLIGGVPVQVGSEGWAAQFVVKKGAVQDFTVHVRHYTATQEQALVLPLRQVVGGVRAEQALGAADGELMLVYLDMGEDGLITVDWILG